MTTFTEEVRQTVSPHKFGGSRRTAAAWLTTLDGCEDESSGDCESPTGWFARVGRTMVYSDSCGFVDSERFATESAAHAWFEVLESRYDEWRGDDDI